MRIVVLLNAYWLRSGADIRAAEILRRWADAGHEVHVLAPRIALEILPSPTAMPERRLPIWHCTDEAPVRSGLLRAYAARTARAIRTLSGFRRAWGDEFVLYSATDSFPDVLPCRLAARHGIRWVGCCYHIVEDPSTRPGNRFWNHLSQFSQSLSLRDLRHADRLVVDNTGLRDALVARFGFSPDRVACHACGIDRPAEPDPEADSGSPKDSYPLVFCGRVKPSKGILDFLPLLRTLRSLRPEYEEVRVGIVGSQDERFARRVLAAAAEAGLASAVRLLGPLETAARDALYRRASLFVSLSHEEGWGMAVAEALASALPVAAYDLPCYREAFPELLRTVPLGDIGAMARLVDALLQDATERRRLGTRGRDFVLSHYTYETVARHELDLFRPNARTAAFPS